MVLAELPPRAVPKCKAAEGLLAFVATAKGAWHQPLNRIQEMLANEGFDVLRSTLWEWFCAVAEALAPIYAAMVKEVQASGVIETDETPVRLWDKKAEKMRVGRQWTYLNNEHTVFVFTTDRKKKHPAKFLENSTGIILSDAYTAYRSIAKASGGRLTNAFCMAHLRRMFWKAKGTDSQRALVGLAYFKSLYAIERKAEGWTPARRLKLRRKDSKPILAKFKAWIDEQGLAVAPKSPIGKAFAYAQKNWKELTRFADDGRLRIDNNRSENMLRPIALGRRNWLRYESERGGEVGAVIASFVASCRRHGVNPFEYFRDVLRRIPTHRSSRILDLTPARWKPKPDSS